MGNEEKIEDIFKKSNHLYYKTEQAISDIVRFCPHFMSLVKKKPLVYKKAKKEGDVGPR